MQSKEPLFLRKGSIWQQIQKKNSENTVFPIGSLSKQFVSLSILQLIENGLLELEGKVSKILPEFSNHKEMSIKHLLTHRSGLKNPLSGDVKFDQKFFNLPKSKRDLPTLVNIIANADIDFSPGEKFKYSNSGYIVLSYLIEKITGETLFEYFNKNIFIPLGMSRTQPAVLNFEKKYNSQGYILQDGVLTPADESLDYEILTLSYGSGYLSSSANDMQKWLVSFNSDRLLPRELKSTLFLKYTPVEDMGVLNKYHYGLGWFVSKGGSNVAHGGNTPSFTGFVSKYLKDGVDIVILTNKEMVADNKEIELESYSMDIYFLWKEVSEACVLQ